MKKILFYLMVAVLVSFGTAVAVPIPFQVGTGSYLTDDHIGPLNFTATALGTSVFYLDEGETMSDIPFFNITLAPSLAVGNVTASIDLQFPTPLAAFESTGLFGVFSIGSFSIGGIHWWDPITVPYSYNGMANGQLTLNLYDLGGLKCGNTFTIKGEITNNMSPAPIPGAIMLLGSGLFGLAVFRRKIR